MRPDTIQEELFKLFANLGGNVTALNSNSYTTQAWLHQINELVAGGGVGAIKVSPTAPVSPVAGDLWYNPNTGIWGFWRSPYWLTAQTYHTADRAAAAGNTDVATTPGLRYANPGAGAELVFVESCWAYRIPGGQNINSGDGSNYTTLRWGYHNANGTSYASIHEKNSNTIDNVQRYRFNVNAAYTVTGFSMQRAIVGTVDIANSVRMGVTYRVIL